MITIVTGLPRSGTSLMMQLLEAAGLPLLTDGVRQADAGNPQGYYEYEKVKSLQKDAGWFQEAEGKAVKVIIQLLQFLPVEHQYRFILMQRPLDEIIRSQNRMIKRMGRTGAVISLETVFEQQLKRTAIRLENTKMPMLRMDYHLLLKQPLPEIQKLNRFLGLPDASGAMLERIRPDLWHERI